MRNSRYRRAEAPTGLIPQPRDLAILLSVDSYGFLSREQIQKLHFGPQSPFGGSTGVHRACRRLRQLYDHSFLERLWVPRTALGLPDPVDSPLAITGSPPALYRLGPAGVPLVARAREEDTGSVQARHRRRLKPITLAHELLLNEIRLQLELRTRRDPAVRLERWLGTTACFARYQTVAPETDRPVQRAFAPDGFFRLYVGEAVLAAFVEADLATESVHRRFRKKIQDYRVYARSGEFRTRFGQSRFRVLTVTTSPARIKTLTAVTASEPGSAAVFWFTTRAALLAGTDFLTEAVWHRTPDGPLEALLPPAAGPVHEGQE